MRAVILAGGRGTRLRSVVSDVPKPLAPVAGRPFLWWFLDRLESHGFTDVVLSIGYLGHLIRDALGDRHGSLLLRYVVEEQPLGTGGGLRDALEAAGGYPVFAFNGDTYIEIDYTAMLKAHQSAGADLTVAVRPLDDASRYGRACIEDGRIAGFESAGQDGPGLINAGVYLFSHNMLKADALPPAFSFERDFLEPRAAELRPYVFVSDAYFIDIGVPDDYARAQSEIPAHRQRR